MRAVARFVFICCVTVVLGREQIIIDLDGHVEEEEPSPPVGASVLGLNRFIFAGNVLQPSPHVKQWVVLYCLPWFQPCQEYQLAYNELAMRTQEVYNLDTYSTGVRFAQVDCSKDKVLCNDMGATFFPYVVLYEDGNASSSWIWSGRGNVESKVSAWIDEQLSKSQIERQVRASLEPNPLEDVLIQCGAILQSSWLGQMWDALGADLREGLALVAMSASLWALFRKMCHCGDYVTKKSTKPHMQHISPRDTIAVKSFMLPSDLRKRRQLDPQTNQRPLPRWSKSLVL